MLHSTVSHVLRRAGVSIQAQAGENEIKYPTWGIVLFASTLLFFTIVSSALEYTFGRLIPTLVMVETPQAILFKSISPEETDAPFEKHDPEVLLLKQAPITSKFRTTIKHLVSRGGFFARWRGASIWAIYHIFALYLTYAIQGLGFTHFPNHDVAPILSAIILANLSMAWTHIVISEPSNKRWYQRMPALRLWKKVAGPTALFAIAKHLTDALPLALARSYVFPADPTDPMAWSNLASGCRRTAALKVFSILALAVALFFLIVIPANVILTRVQASLLPEDEETIVPFDRSFGGKVVPEVVAGSGVVSILDAWKTFDWNARARLLKTYAKYMAMQIAISALCFATISAQIYLIMGDDIRKLVEMAMKEAKGQAGNEPVTILPVEPMNA